MSVADDQSVDLRFQLRFLFSRPVPSPWHSACICPGSQNCPESHTRGFRESNQDRAVTKNARLDRQGKAICRIVHAATNNLTLLADVLGVNRNVVQTAVYNTLSRKYHPPVAGRSAKITAPGRSKPAPRSTQRSNGPATPRTPTQTLIQKATKSPAVRRHALQSSRSISRKIDDVHNNAGPSLAMNARPEACHHPLLHSVLMTLALNWATTLAQFLLDVSGYKLSKARSVFEHNGLCTIADLKKLGRVEEKARFKALPGQTVQ
ncbi:hypothetical protein C8R45DRAFT_1208763 [Mycena sanguinolenta]|nr:hypothetical protein C8R45DRAFT_1208763 [Mycena sanguinolenta]